MNFYLFIEGKKGGALVHVYVLEHIVSLKASAHSFKQFTSRLLKLPYSLYAHI